MTRLLNMRVLLQMAAQTLRNPQEGAHLVMGLALPSRVLWLFFALQLVLSAIIKTIVFELFPQEGANLSANTAINLSIAEAVIAVILVFAITYIGRHFKGHGTFDQGLTLVLWLQFILLCMNVVQIGVMLILPPAGQVLTFLALALSFWLLAQFIAALHGFTSLGRIFLGIVLTLMAMAFLFNILFALLGIQVA